MAWVPKLSRRPLVGPAVVKATGDAPPKPPVPPELAPIVPKAWARYAPLLAGAEAELTAIAERAAALPGPKAKAASRALDRFYGELGRALDALPQEAREQVLAGANHLVDQLFVRLRGDDRLLGALEVLLVLLTRGSSAEDGRARLEVAERTLTALLDRLNLRSGSPGLLFAFRNVVELTVPNKGALPLGTLEARWRACADLLLDGTPAKGATQAEVGVLVGRVMAALRAAPPGTTPEATLGACLTEEFERHRPAKEALLAQLGRPIALPAGHAGAGPARAVLDALSQILGEHPVPGPDLLTSIALISEATLKAAPLINAASAPAWRGLASMFAQIGRHAVAEPLLAHYHQVALVNVRARQVLASPVAHGSPAVTHFACQAAVAQRRFDTAPLAALPPDQAGAVALALSPVLGSGGFMALYPEVIARAKDAASPQALIGFAARFAEAHKRTYGLGEPLGGPLAIALADAVDQRRVATVANDVTAHVKALRPAFPQLDVGALVVGKRPGEAGLAEIPAKNERHGALLPLLRTLLGPVNAAEGLERGPRSALGRRALKIASALAQLDRPPQEVANRVAADWTLALANPDRLNGLGGSGVQVRRGPSVLAFLEAHPELPPEVAITAGLHLSREGLERLSSACAEERSHGQVRAYRDLVFLAVEKAQPDLVEVLLAAPRTLRDAWLGRLVGAYRQGQKDLDLEAARVGVKEGRLPEGNGPLGLNADPLTKLIGVALTGPADPGAAAEILGLKKELTSLAAFFPPGKATWGVDNAAFIEPLQAFLKAYAEGRVAEHKYGSPISAAMLAGLSEDARVHWAERSVTSVEQGPLGPTWAEVVPLLRGLVAVLPKVDLNMPGWPPITFDPASLQALERRRDEALQRLRDGEKGSPGHADAARTLGLLRGRLDVLALGLTLAAGGPNVDATLRAAAPHLKGAQAFLRRVGGEGLAEVVGQLDDEAHRLRPTRFAGRYVTDDHSLTGFLTAFGTGCINPTNGINRGVLVEKLNSSRYKMCLAWQDDKLLLRSFLRLVEVELPGYKGPALWLDPATNAGRHPVTPQQTTELSAAMITHALDKAQAMGIPFLTTSIGKAAAGRKVELKRGKATLQLDRGHTGIHHTQRIGFGVYGVSWPGVNWPHGKTRPAAGQDVVKLAGAVEYVLPAPAPEA